jgi:hypothetical protein
MREIDDLGSKAHDQARKAVDPVWLFSGVTQPSKNVRPGSASPSDPQPGREDIPALYGPVGADAKALVAEIDLAAIFARMENMVAEMERDYPELDMSVWNVSSAASGAARRVARQRVAVRALERRSNYDLGLVRAQQMAIAIGGEKGYPGYDGFNLQSYAQGDLQHQIAPRAVFPPDVLDDEEIRQAFWIANKLAVEAGASLEGVLKVAGVPQAQISLIVPPESPAAQMMTRDQMNSLIRSQGEPGSDEDTTSTADGQSPDENKEAVSD